MTPQRPSHSSYTRLGLFAVFLALLLFNLSRLAPAAYGQGATTLTVGGFDLSRGGQGSVQSGSFLSNFRARLSPANFPGTTFVLTGAPTLTASYLDTLDILVIASPTSNGSAITPLSASEQQNVSDFIQAGGRFLLISDNATFGGVPTTEQANASILAPAGVTPGGINGSGNIVALSPSSHPVISGRSGTWTSAGTAVPGSWANTGAATVLGHLNGNVAQPALAAFEVGDLGALSARGVIISDINAIDSAANVIMTNNIVDYLIPTVQELLLDMAVLGNGQAIADDDTTPSLTDHTHFGGILPGGTITRTFTISNSGATALNLTGSPVISLTGPAAGDFSVTSDPATPVPAGATTTFQISFTPSVVGMRSATLSIAHDRGNEPYNFAIRGTGLVSVAPGGVNGDLHLWFKANSGVSTSGSNVTTWADQSGNNFNATASGNPILSTNRLNTYPTIDFNGSTARLATGPLQLFETKNSGLSVYTVFDTDNNEGQKFLLAKGISVNCTDEFELGYDTGFTSGSGNFGLHRGCSNAIIAPANTVSNNTYTLMGTLVPTSGTTPNNLNIYKDGALLAVSNNASGWLSAGSYDTSSEPLDIGTRLNAPPTNYNSFHDGEIAEIVVYAAPLNSAQHQRVQSYLALKYGLTLVNTVNYVAANGTVVYPSTSTHNGYTRDIAGFGLDDTSALSQISSRSANANSLIIMTGTLASLTNGEFLVWGSDNGALAPSADVPPTSPSAQRLTRKWRVAETGEAGNVTISFDLSTLSGINFSQPDEFGLLIDNDGNFSNASVITGAMINGSVVTFSGINFTNGDHFSLAYPLAPILALSKTVSPASAAPGQTITYRLAFTNSNNIAAGVVLADIVPVTLTNLSYTNTGATITPTGGSNFTWNVQDLSPGQGGVITLTGQINPLAQANTSFTNTATISATGAVSRTASAGATISAAGGGGGLIYLNDIDSDSNIFAVYNIAANTWTTLTPYPHAAQMAVSASGQLYAVNRTTRRVQLYNPSGAGSWSDVTLPLPVGVNMGNLESTNGGEFFYTQYGVNTLFYTTGGGATWNTRPLGFTANVMGDYDPTTNQYALGELGSTRLHLINVTTFADTVFTVGAGGAGELRRLNSVLNGRFYFHHDSTGSIRSYDLSNPAIGPTITSGTIPGGSFYPSSAASRGNNQIYLSSCGGNPFHRLDPTTGTFTTLAPFNPGFGCHSSLALIPDNAASDVGISKAVTLGGPAQPGQAITYTLTFRNVGGSPARGVVITDIVPVSLTNLSVASSGAAITDTGASPAFVWNVQELAAGQSGVITLTGQISPNLVAGAFTNTATITSTGDNNAANNTASAGVMVDVPTITFSSAAYNVGEGAGEAVITVTLSAEPFAPVTAIYTTGDNTATAGDDYSTSSGTVTVLTGTTSATFTVPITDDALVESHETVTVTLSSPAGAVLGTPNPASLTISDDDTPGILVNPTALTLSEPGSTATFTITLTSQPTATVTILLFPSLPSECSTPASASLDQVTWNSGVTVTVSAVDDGIADGTQTCMIQTTATSSDTLYHNLAAADVTVTVLDDDTPGITLSALTSITTTEAGGSASFQVRLDSRPTAPVTLTLSSGDTSEGIAGPASLVFTTLNWNLSRTVTITGQDDTLSDGDIAYTLTFSPATSADPNYNGLAPKPASFILTNLDNDTPGLILTSLPLSITEGLSKTYQLRLSSQPAAPVTLTLTTDGETGVSPTSLVFTPANWNQPQTVTVTALNDGQTEAAHTGLISHTVTSPDPNYANLAPVMLTVTLDDAASNPVSRLLYLPLLMQSFNGQPDLIIEQLQASGSAITVTVRNIGNGPVNDSFWLDIYFNPSQPPVLNQPWDTLAPKGAVWGVTEPLAPGQRLTLTLGDRFYTAHLSSPLPFPAGATVYGYVDSINFDTNYGNVLERNEQNNRFGPTPSIHGPAELPLLPQANPPAQALPRR